MQRALLLLALLALPFAAQAENRDSLVKKYSGFAGSEANARSLVDGLRDGRKVTLSDGATTATFKPATGTMGYGNVGLALALAEADLKKQGITDPTPAQLQAEMTGILRERADRKGWGVIAQERGFKVGELVRAERAERVARVEKPQPPERPGRPERPEKPERPEHPDRSARGPR